MKYLTNNNFIDDNITTKENNWRVHDVLYSHQQPTVMNDTDMITKLEIDTTYLFRRLTNIIITDNNITNNNNNKQNITKKHYVYAAF